MKIKRVDNRKLILQYEDTDIESPNFKDRNMSKEELFKKYYIPFFGSRKKLYTNIIGVELI